MPKRTLQGVVVSDKQTKTVVVRVDRRFTHPIYKKTIRRSKNYHAHDENNQFKPGDMVWIEESKPISKLKRWTVVVRVDRRFSHATMKKVIRRSKKYHAHDEKNEFKPGDLVWIEESKPISKLKRWTVVRGEQKKTA